MASTISPNITALLQARSKWRGTVHLPPQTMAKIETIRAEIQSGENDAGWNKVGGWSGNNRFAASGGGGGGGRFSGGGGDYKRFMAKRTNDQPSRFNRQSEASAPPPRYPATAAATATAAVAKQQAAPYSRYVSRFKNTEDTVENVVVNTIIQGKLNKFSVANYEEVRDFLMEILGTGERDFLSDFMRLIFQKAATEPTFCPLYAKLLAELSGRFPFLRDEMNNLYKSFLGIFRTVSDVGIEDMAAFIQKNTEKKYRLGYSQFIAELYNQRIVGTDDLMTTITTIFDQMQLLASSADNTASMEEYADCVLRILRILASQPHEFGLLRDTLMTACGATIQSLSAKSAELPGLNNKVRFAMMDARKVITG
jgi:hypothetical protein